ncbi:hypothetical protein [Ruegeria arenilitoris]|uniref:hypothetical protein n=1 Tax=Ruegeria arenilitoris TaxID=1173585 RepID=UPI001481B014|nr:hypothetical protein [Ruegeria arenilitoris]
MTHFERRAGHELTWEVDASGVPQIDYRVCNYSGEDNAFYWAGANFGMGETCRLPNGACATHYELVEPEDFDPSDPMGASDVKLKPLEFGTGVGHEVLTRFWCTEGGRDLCATGVIGKWNRTVSRWVLPRRKGTEEVVTAEVENVREGNQVSSSVAFTGFDRLWLVLEGEGLLPETVQVSDADSQPVFTIPVTEIIEPGSGAIPGREIGVDALLVELPAEPGAETTQRTFNLISTGDAPVSLALMAAGDRVPQIVMDTPAVLLPAQ